MTNKQIAQKLREVATSYEILGENRFRINAYTQAAESIENLSEDLTQVWKRGDLQKIPGIGGTLAQHLEELFKSGRVAHFEEFIGKMPEGMFELLKIRSIGPKTAFKLAGVLNDKKKFNTKDHIYTRLEKALMDHMIQDLEGFGKKREEDIYEALKQFKKGTKKKKRMLLVEADVVVDGIDRHLKKDTNISKIEYVGSYRRRKDTVGDIDIAVVTKDTDATIRLFLSYEKRIKTIDQGDHGASMLVEGGVQIDMRVIDKKRFGSMLQYFTGSKYHNIRLREYALTKGYSLSEYGIKDTKSGKMHYFSDEHSFYKHIGLSYITPELREDRGEIEASLRKAQSKSSQQGQRSLPKLLQIKDIKGDIHMHSDYDYPSSHDVGVSPLEEILYSASQKGYEYIGLSDHNPKYSSMSETEINTITKERKEYFEQLFYNKKLLQKYSNIKKVYIMYEVDIRPDGTPALPKSALRYLDGIIVSIHSSFDMTLEKMTNRILKALDFPKVRVVGHPTGRLVNKRDQIKADWQKICKQCYKKDIAMEINASPHRLDLPDSLVYQAIGQGVKLIINTDSHQVRQMDHMSYGISVARRGWAEKHDILNTLPFEKFDKWFRKGR